MQTLLAELIFLASGEPKPVVNASLSLHAENFPEARCGTASCVKSLVYRFQGFSGLGFIGFSSLGFRVWRLVLCV